MIATMCRYQWAMPVLFEKPEAYTNTISRVPTCTPLCASTPLRENIGHSSRPTRNATMSYAEATVPEFDQEMASTRKVLERIPDDKLDGKAHPKSQTIGSNANHVADIPSWAVMVLTRQSFDIAPVDGEAHTTPKLTSSREI